MWRHLTPTTRMREGILLIRGNDIRWMKTCSYRDKMKNLALTMAVNPSTHHPSNCLRSQWKRHICRQCLFDPGIKPIRLFQFLKRSTSHLNTFKHSQDKTGSCIWIANFFMNSGRGWRSQITAVRLVVHCMPTLRHLMEIADKELVKFWKQTSRTCKGSRDAPWQWRSRTAAPCIGSLPSPGFKYMSNSLHKQEHMDIVGTQVWVRHKRFMNCLISAINIRSLKHTTCIHHILPRDVRKFIKLWTSRHQERRHATHCM